MNTLAAGLVLVALYCSGLYGGSSTLLPPFLRESDLKKAVIYSDNANPKRPFAWVCIEQPLRNLKASCNDLGLNELEGRKEELQLTVSTPGHIHQYGLRHGIRRAECQRIKAAIERLVSDNFESCIRGGFVNSKVAGKIIRVGWVFDEIKNQKTSLCEFNGCDN